MYKSFKEIGYHPMSPSPRPFGTEPEPEKQETPSKVYESFLKTNKKHGYKY